MGGRWIVAILAMVVVGCTGNESGVLEPTLPEVSQPLSTATSLPDVSGATTPTTAALSSTSSLAEPDPARASPATQGSDSAVGWLGRGEMTEDRIDLQWAGYPDGTSIELHRFSRIEEPDPALADPTGATVMVTGPSEGAFTDTSVDPGERYWYVLVAEVDGDVGRRWTPADAVTDTQPPAVVLGLQTERIDEGVLITWGQSSDNYEFERYAIRRSLNGEQSVYYATGWTIDQTSFIDDQLPDSGTVTWEIIATDFHGNTAEAATISVDIEG